MHLRLGSGGGRSILELWKVRGSSVDIKITAVVIIVIAIILRAKAELKCANMDIKNEKDVMHVAHIC